MKKTEVYYIILGRIIGVILGSIIGIVSWCR